MARAEVGARPLLIQIIRRHVAYIKSCRERTSTMAFTAYDFECNNDIKPNFCISPEKLNLNLQNLKDETKWKIKKLCEEGYDRLWREAIKESPKASLFMKFKTSVYFEKYLQHVKNIKHKKALTRFRVSNHSLMIEKGRQMRPRVERNDRKCFYCRNDVEDEIHFLVKCPVYQENREKLFETCQNNCANFNNIDTDEQKFIFLMTNDDINVMSDLA